MKNWNKNEYKTPKWVELINELVSRLKHGEENKNRTLQNSP